MSIETPVRSILLTPNFCGADGVSMLSRQFAAAMPTPPIVISLHDRPQAVGGGVELRAASGSRAAFCRAVIGVLPSCASDTLVVCCHLHLAPVAWLLRVRTSRIAVVLCGIEAWVPLRTAERWALRSANILAISSHTARRFAEANPALATATVTIVHPGLPDTGAPADASSSDERPTALVVGRMAADEGYKGHDALIGVWPRVLERHPSARLMVVGEGTDRRRIETLARDTGVAEAVVFTGRIDDAALAALYRRATFFVMPSKDEGFGFVFLEAMRAGRACIGARGAAEEIIEHDVSGLIVDPADSSDILGAMLRLFDDPGLSRRFGEAGRRRYAAEFTDLAFRARVARACGFGRAG